MDDPVSDHDDLLARALKRFDEIATATLAERAMSLEDRRFVFIDGAQWEGAWGEQWENGIRVQINKAQRGHDKIINDYRANRFTVNFRPKGTLGDDDTAELLNGLLFADMYRSKGQQALDNAFGEGASGGFGAFRLCNEYEDDSDPDDDAQRIAIEQIPDADQRVFFDLDAKLYDKSDARFGFVLSSYTPDGLKEAYGEDSITSWPEQRIGRYRFDWYMPDVVIVAEYYELETPTEELRILTREATGEEYRYWAQDMPADMVTDYAQKGFKTTKRKIKRKRVRKWVMTGSEVLEDSGYIAGENIPIVPFYGKRVFIDNVERFKGHVRDAKDPCRVYNAQISKLVETASLAPREVPIFAPEQMEGLQHHWAEMNLKRAPYALANPLLDPVTGQIVSASQNGSIKPPDVPPVLAALIQQTGNDIAEITYGDDSSMEVKSNVSGEAMDIAASRVDAKSYIYMDNFKGTIQRFGEVYYSMAKQVYIEEGREVETMDEDGNVQTATLHEIAVDPTTGASTKRYDLSVGKYNVVADVTEATATRRDKTVRTMMTFAEAAASIQALDLGKAALLTAAENMDGEGVDDFQQFVHKLGVSIGLAQPTPEEQQQMQQNQQPDPQSILALAQAKALNAQADNFATQGNLNNAKSTQALADAHLKNVQAGAAKASTAIDAHKANTDAAHKNAQLSMHPTQAMPHTRPPALPKPIDINHIMNSAANAA